MLIGNRITKPPKPHRSLFGKKSRDSAVLLIPGEGWDSKARKTPTTPWRIAQLQNEALGVCRGAVLAGQENPRIETLLVPESAGNRARSMAPKAFTQREDTVFDVGLGPGTRGSSPPNWRVLRRLWIVLSSSCFLLDITKLHHTYCPHGLFSMASEAGISVLT